MIARSKAFGIWTAILLLMPVVIQCGRSDGRVMSEEELRVASSQHIDTTYITSMTAADSIAVRDLWDAVSAEAWILVEDSSGLLISAKNIDKRMYPASLTKMMTCILGLERGNLADSIEITEDVCLTTDSRVRPGDCYLLGNMIDEMMLQSDNNAATALAQYISGDIPAFCRLMNEKAAYLGMDSTHFANPNGMPNDSTYSSARDLLVLARYCMRDSAFAAIVGTPFMDIPLVDGRHLPCDNTNLLLRSYEGCIGVKTGYTRDAGSCLASAATRDGVTLFLVLLNSRSRSSRFTESALLLDHGFSLMARRNAAQQQ